MADRVRIAETGPGAGDIGTVKGATAVLEGRSRRRGPLQLLPFLGPAFIASVAYMDPFFFYYKLSCVL